MTRIAARATRGRGKKCPKGQACASNPETKKHRAKIAQLFGVSTSESGDELANSMKPKLTRDMLEKFDAIQQQKQRNTIASESQQQMSAVENWLQIPKNQDENDSNNSKSENSNNESMNTDDNQSIPDDAFTIGNISAASIWSNCTNVTFDKFLNGFDPKSKIHKAMLTVLATVRDAIDMEKGNETETEYFSGLMLALDCVDSEEKLTATLALLQMVLKRVQTPVLRLKFSETSTALMKILSQQINVANPNSYLTKSVINALHTLLRNQELVVWQLKSTQQIFETILMFVTHQKPRIRKAACFAVISLVCGNNIESMNANQGSPIAAKLTAEFCIRKLDQNLSTTNDEHLNIILYILTLLSDTMSMFPSVQHTKHLAESILSHMTLGNILLVTGALHTLYSFFLLRPTANVLSAELNARLLNALYDYQPNINDEQPLNAWCVAMKEALLCLHNLDRKLFSSHAPKLFRTFITILQSDSSSVHSNVVNSIKSLMKTIIEDSNSSMDLLEKLYDELENGLKYQFSHVWTQFMPIFGEVFIVTKETKLLSKMGAIIQRMAIIYESNDADVNDVLEKVFAKIISSHGPRFVLQYCPIIWKTSTSSLMSEYNEFCGEFTNPWLISLLRENIDAQSELSLFVDHFLPMVDELMKKVLLCQKLTQKLKETAKNRMQIDDDQSTNRSYDSCLVMIKELKRCVHAIWSLLPALCRNPIDVKETFPKIAKRIGENLYNKELAIYSLAALRNLFKCDHSTQCIVGSFGKNFLPILFNIYTNENENTRIDQDLRYPVYIVISHMIRCMLENESDACQTMYHNFFNKLITILKESPGSDFRRIALIEIVDAFLWTPEGLKINEIEYIYDKIAGPLIDSSKCPADQKKGFRLIEPIVQSRSNVCEEFLSKHMESIINLMITLFENDKILSPSSRAYALRLLNSIIQRLIDDNIHGKQDAMSNINLIILIENIVPSILKQLTIKSSKTKKQARNILLTISECFETLNNDKQQANEKLISLIIDPIENNKITNNNDDRTSRLDAIAYLFVEKFHHPLIEERIVARIADTIFSCLSTEILDHCTRPMLNICFEFIRHFFLKSTPNLFNCYLEVITCGITNLPMEHRTRFHQTVKVLLTKLCRKFGFELIDSMISEDYKKVMKNIRKLEERKKKQKKMKKQSMSDDDDDDDQSDRKTTRSKKSRKYLDLSDDDEEDVERFVNDEFDDVDDDDDDGDGRSTRKSFRSRTNKHLDIMSRLSNVSIKSYIRESMDGDPIDLLSSNAKQNVFSKIPNKSKQSNNGSADKSSDVSNNNLPYSEDGRLNIGRLFDQLEGKRGQKRSADDSNIDGDEDDDDSDDDSDNKTQFTSKSYKPGGRGIHRPVASSSSGQKPGNDNRSMVSSKRSSKKSAKSKKSSILHGDVYRSKKAAGDMKRRGLPDPYAYYPLNAMSLNRRKHLKQRGELKAIVKSARQGAAKGRHIRNKRHKTQK
uniref:RRP12-like protein n=1 Tax=Dermatophagoides pteronyssinus TaxID=6956 RepID=A0A6P6XPK0_DERPT|nr:RRP12-like protein [Dermatophagoides pteronyssinus]